MTPLLSKRNEVISYWYKHLNLVLLIFASHRAYFNRLVLVGAKLKIKHQAKERN